MVRAFTLSDSLAGRQDSPRGFEPLPAPGYALGLMDSFVRRMIERLHDPASALSRNRHFHTFETPEGRQALKTSRRLKSLQRDIIACHREGRPVEIAQIEEGGGALRIELSFVRIRGRRTAILEPAELELLAQLPGVRESLRAQPPEVEPPAVQFRGFGSQSSHNR